MSESAISTVGIDTSDLPEKVLQWGKVILYIGLPLLLIAGIIYLIILARSGTCTSDCKCTYAPTKKGGKAPAAMRQEIAGRSQRAEPLSVYIALPDAPPLAQGLTQQAPDPRQQLTITAPYEAARVQSRAAALEAALALAGEAREAGLVARIVLEPGQGVIRAELAFDAAGLPR